ncbi:hypothetical protein [Pseudoroseomonas cervicalis]|uniref:hypothetical protein n=1 Tax=Teichococcus cervicalis TaxID=204525 RepID=UPI0022F1D49A|nr:hypothetical protein [Pseudoroseomonas cervicalis]WBV42732.1 hypothetical protein PFY06_16030 [Pseudoroseomonas cervicalis]
MTWPSKRDREADRLAEILRTKVQPLKRSVYRARTWPMHSHDTPAALVYGYQETKVRAGRDMLVKTFDVSCIMAVQIRVVRPVQAGEAAERELGELCGLIHEAVLTDAALALADDGIEDFGELRTVINAELKGEFVMLTAGMSIQMKWSEVYEIPDPPVDCEDAVLALQTVPPLP